MNKHTVCQCNVYTLLWDKVKKKRLKDTYPEEFEETDCFNLSSQGTEALQVWKYLDEA